MAVDPGMCMVHVYVNAAVGGRERLLCPAFFFELIGRRYYRIGLKDY
jgi:hypothetical protein